MKIEKHIPFYRCASLQGRSEKKLDSPTRIAGARSYHVQRRIAQERVQERVSLPRATPDRAGARSYRA